MNSGDKILEKIRNQPNDISFILELADKNYELKKTSISKSSTPVKKPTKRGGLYQTEKEQFIFRGTIYDSSVIPLLSKTMLGPNKEFTNLKIKMTSPQNLNQEHFLVAHLVNSMQSSSYIELTMKIISISFKGITFNL